MIDITEAWSKQADEMITRSAQTGPGGYGFSEAVHFATSMLTALYGPESPQLRQFREGSAACSHKAANSQNMGYILLHHALGAIRAANTELKAGLIVRLRVAVAGEILTELIGLAKDILGDRTDAAKNTGAVLVAAAYESLIRRLGEEFAGVTDRRKLEEIVTALKTAGVLKGGQVGTAISYLKFRNDSLHADWNAVDRSQVESCLAFTESLLLKHFS